MIYNGYVYPTDDLETAQDYDAERIEDARQNAYDKKMEEEGYVRCEYCHRWVEDTTNDICEECLQEILDSLKLENTIEYAKHCSGDSLFILLTEYVFNKEQVIEILTKIAKETDRNTYKKDLKEFVDNDIYDYIDYLKKKGEI